jgi:hypothetical protein
MVMSSVMVRDDNDVRPSILVTDVLEPVLHRMKILGVPHRPKNAFVFGQSIEQ